MPEIVMMPRDHGIDQVLRNVQQNNFVGQNNITNVVEHILAHNGLNIGIHRHDYVSSLSEYV